MAASFGDLSPELLVKIFTYYIESNGNMAFSTNVVPVCKAWWEMSATPSFWKSVHVQDWSYAMSLSKRGLLYHTENLKINCYDTYGRIFSLDGLQLKDVLSTIDDLKSLEMPIVSSNANKMVGVICPYGNLERLHIRSVNRFENPQPIMMTISILGFKLKHINLDFCKIELSEVFMMAVAISCRSLEVLEWRNVDLYPKFPIHEFVDHPLRRLELRGCDIINRAKNLSGFKDLEVFKVWGCPFHELDLYSILKNSRNLKELELKWNVDLKLNLLSEIQCNNVTFLEIRFRDRCTEMETAVDQAVAKWKHTLLHLQISYHDANSLLEMFLDDNPTPKLKALRIEGSSVEPSLLKAFTQKCKNLDQLGIRIGGDIGKWKTFTNREQIMKFWNGEMPCESDKQYAIQWC